MKRVPVLACEVKAGQLIVARDSTRVRVTSTVEISARDTVIIYGSSACGDVGIGHGITEEVTRLL